MTLYWSVLAGAICASMLGQTLLKAGSAAPSFIAQLMDWRTLVGLVVYGCASMLYIVALRRIPVSVALPSTAVSYIAIAVIGHYVFGEALGLQQMGAIGLISLGVLLLALA